MRSVRLVPVAVLLMAGVTLAARQASAPVMLRTPGVQQPVEVLRDPWGINHIYAKNEHDLFFAQGYLAARDRLFQFELWRRQATGTVAEILGRRELKRDIGTRLHMFRGDLDEELNWYHPHGAAIVHAYVDGVNASIAEAMKNPAALPIEFKMLGITPKPWTAAVVVSRHNALLANIGQELKTAQAVRVLGPAGVKALSYFQGGDPVLAPDPAIDLSLINDQILDLYDAFRRPIRFTADEIAPEYRRGPGAAGRGDEASAAGSAAGEDEEPRPEDIGSNDWVVSGALTPGGFPMMMNDPHRTQSAPALRYWVHLVAPGWDVIGAGEPVLPGVSIGHNQYGAWGLTVFGNDSEDLYVYDTNPANPNQYRYRGAWEDMRVIKDSIPVKGEAPVSVDLKFTRHGPVLAEDPAHHKAYALRAAWMDIGSAPYLASLRMDQARSWDEFREACSYSRIPSENMVWADVKGNIGYQAVGVAPLRPNWSGLVPVPGDGRYEWAGYLPIKALPHALNPAKGYIATANNYLFPPNYPYPEAVHYTWADPFRASRIAAVLGSGALNTVADMIRLQNDVTSLPARSLVPLLRDVRIDDAATAKARDLLVGWNDVLDPDSVPAGIYEMWMRRLMPNLRDLLVPKAAQPYITLSVKKAIDWLNAPDGRFGSDPLAGRNELLVRSLTEALADLTKKLGPDMAHWQWGQNAYHHALIRHPLGEAVNAEMHARLDVGPYPRGGDSYTINATGGGDNQVSGGSMKIIADTGDWDDSLGLNNPGQSGDPDSPHYRDLFELWARGKYFPIFFSRSKVESVVEERLLLQP
ncbi:MAG: penicillin acylase family protein [Betaproteobacteria bacterium]